MSQDLAASQPQSQSPARAKRPWWSFSFRSPLILATMVALALLIVLGSALALYEQWCVSHLRSLGARVGYAPKGSCYWVTPEAGTDAAKFLKDGATDLRYLSRQYAIALDLKRSAVSDSDLGLLWPIKGPLDLDLRETAVTNEGLRNLSALKNPRLDLDLRGTAITDQGLMYLQPSGAEELRLDLRDTAVTDEGLQFLRQMKNLRSVWLSNTNVTAQGPYKLRRALPNCSVNYEP